MQKNNLSLTQLGAACCLALLMLVLSACSGNDGENSNDNTGDSGHSGENSDPVSGNTDFFNHTMPWTTDISNAPLHTNSTNIIDYLENNQENPLQILQIDFTSLHVVQADRNSPRVTYDPTADLVYGLPYGFPPCDNVIDVPIPAGGRIEGADGYECAETQSEDCHLLIHDIDAGVLYELYHASVIDMGGNQVVGAKCAVLWDLEYDYGDDLRGQNCTSADAAGLAISPLLVTADEIAAGEIGHALRFILQNNLMRAGLHVYPATHSGGPQSNHPDSPIYGMRFRLRADFPVDTLGESGRVIAVALQRYGAILVDGGNLPFTFMDDHFSTHKWDEFDDFGPHMFNGVMGIGDFEIVNNETPINSTHDCEMGIDYSDKLELLVY